MGRLEGESVQRSGASGLLRWFAGSVLGDGEEDCRCCVRTDGGEGAGLAGAIGLETCLVAKDGIERLWLCRCLGRDSVPR